MSVTNTCNIKDNPCLYDKADRKTSEKKIERPAKSISLEIRQDLGIAEDKKN